MRRVSIPTALVTGLLAAELVFRPIPFGLALRAWLVAVGALAAAALVRASLSPYRQVHVAPLSIERRRPQVPERPAGLAEVERAVDFAAWNPADLNRRLRPLLREVAVHRLQNRRGVDIERNPELARRLLGDVAWDLIVGLPAIQPEGSRPFAGPPAIRETIERLEAL
ncbi:MAG: hypothetical protein M3Z98_04265 [Candidatus Dormibacteraeota bacterium]|nr:hypothetical protein [Candidatus Dormibacteraeota bacterium]